jgi:hypothetical protein
VKAAAQYSERLARGVAHAEFSLEIRCGNPRVFPPSLYEMRYADLLSEQCGGPLCERCEGTESD